MHLRYTLFILVLHLAHAEGWAQATARSYRKELRESRRTERREWRLDTTKWDRMPLWSVGFLFGKGANGPGVQADNVKHPDNRSRATYRLEGAYRLRKGWTVGAYYENRTLRCAGLANAVWIDGYSTGWFGEGWNTYSADIISVQHRVNTLGLMTGYYNAPFPRRKSKSGYTVAVAGGFGVHMATASYGVERDTQCTVRFEFLGPDEHDVLARWSGRDEFAKHTAFGVSALFDLRAELWFGGHVSIMLPMLGFTVPLVKPHFAGARDEASGVSLHSYDLDLVSTTISTGIVAHF